MEFRKIIRSKKWAIEMRSNWYGFLKYQMSPIFGTHWWSRGISIIRLLPFRDVLPSPGNIISHNLKVFFFFWVSFNVLAKTFRFTELSKLKTRFWEFLNLESILNPTVKAVCLMKNLHFDIALRLHVLLQFQDSLMMSQTKLNDQSWTFNTSLSSFTSRLIS